MFRGICLSLLIISLMTLTTVANYDDRISITKGGRTVTIVRNDLPDIDASTLTWDSCMMLVFDSLKRLEDADKRIESKVDALNQKVSDKLEQHTSDIASIRAQVAAISGFAATVITLLINWAGNRKHKNGKDNNEEKVKG